MEGICSCLRHNSPGTIRQHTHIQTHIHIYIYSVHTCTLIYANQNKLLGREPINSNSSIGFMAFSVANVLDTSNALMAWHFEWCMNSYTFKLQVGFCYVTYFFFFFFLLHCPAARLYYMFVNRWDANAMLVRVSQQCMCLYVLSVQVYRLWPGHISFLAYDKCQRHWAKSIQCIRFHKIVFTLKRNAIHSNWIITFLSLLRDILAFYTIKKTFNVMGFLWRENTGNRLQLHRTKNSLTFKHVKCWNCKFWININVNRIRPEVKSHLIVHH